MTTSRRRVPQLWVAIAGLLGIATASAVPNAGGQVSGPRTTALASMERPVGVEDRAPAAEVTPLPPEPEPEPPSRPAPEPVPAPAPPQPPTVAERCREALTSVAAGGLRLPAGVDYRCPSTQFAHHGTACWDWGPCAGGAFIAVNMDMLAGYSQTYLRHVVAHEVCHIYDFQRTGRTSEWGADACAAAYGFPA